MRREYSTAHFWNTLRARKGGDMGKPGRQANFELLRIIAMFMVVILHWNTNSGLLLDVGSPVTGAGVWSLVTESVCIVAVNVYVLISGYFLSSCTFSFRRVAQVLVQTLFYTVLIPPVLALVGVLSWSEVLNPYHIWNSIFPVQSGHYWFVSAYVVLCLLSPFFNAGLETLSPKRMQQPTGGHPAHETALHAGGLHDVHQVVFHIVGDLHLTVSCADIGRFLRRDHRVQLAEHRLRRRAGQHFHLLLPVHVPQ